MSNKKIKTDDSDMLKEAVKWLFGILAFIITSVGVAYIHEIKVKTEYTYDFIQQYKKQFDNDNADLKALKDEFIKLRDEIKNKPDK